MRVSSVELWVKRKDHKILPCSPHQKINFTEGRADETVPRKSLQTSSARQSFKIERSMKTQCGSWFRSPTAVLFSPALKSCTHTYTWLFSEPRFWQMCPLNSVLKKAFRVAKTTLLSYNPLLHLWICGRRRPGFVLVSRLVSEVWVWEAKTWKNSNNSTCTFTDLSTACHL